MCILNRLHAWLERDGPLACLLTMPSAIWMVALIGYPAVLVLWMSLHNQLTVEANAAFIGLAGYLGIISSSDFWHSARLTLTWTLANLVLIVPVGVAVAVLLNSQFPGQRFVRTWMLLPWMFPIVITILMWRWILDPVAGVINFILLSTKLLSAPTSFFASSQRAMATVVFVNSWRWIPFMATVTLAALQTIPMDIYEAARVDGASPVQMFWKITLPMIRPTVAGTSFILAMWLFNMFPPIWLMTQGGPGDATTTLPILIYKQGLQLFRMGEAAATAVLLLFFFVLPMALIYFTLEHRASPRGN
jgi:multiple sugar transport system permease protein